MPRLLTLASFVLVSLTGCATPEAPTWHADRSAPTEPSPVASGASPSADSALECAATSRTELRAIEDEQRAGRVREARERIGGLVRSLLSAQELEASPALVEVLIQAARRALELADHATARDACERALPLAVVLHGRPHALAMECRQVLGTARLELGDVEGARAILDEALAIYAETPGERELDALRVRLSRAGVEFELGDLRGARIEYETVLAGFERLLPPEHPHRIAAMQNLALVLRDLGELETARGFEERVLELRVATQGPDHIQVQGCRLNLGITLKRLGEYARARPLLEAAVENYTRLLGPTHDLTLRARSSLAGLLRFFGDYEAARSEKARVLELQLARHPDNHVDVQLARIGLASALRDLGDHDGALALSEIAAEHLERELPAGHQYVNTALDLLASTLLTRGDSERARTVLERLLEHLELVLPPDDPEFLTVRLNLAVALRDTGEVEAALELARDGYARACATLLPGDRNRRAAGHALTLTLLHAGAREELVRVATKVAVESRRALLADLAVAAPRELELRAIEHGLECGHLASLASGMGRAEPFAELDREAFVYAAGLRGLALQQAALLRGSARSSETTRAVLAEARAQSRELARLMRTGASGEELVAARSRLDALQREWLGTMREDALGFSAAPTPEEIALELESDQALVFFFSHRAARPDPANPRRSIAEDRMLAWVVRDDHTLTRVDLGPTSVLREAVSDWRSALGAPVDGRGVGVGTPGASRAKLDQLEAELVRLVVDPLTKALDGTRTLWLVPDDALHLVPFDALRTEEGWVGDRWTVNVPPSLAHFLHALEDESSEQYELFAVGGVDYERAAPSLAAGPDLRGAPALLARRIVGRWEPLPNTRAEAHAIVQLASSSRPVSTTHLLENEHATVDAVAKLAPRARYLHLATHGWFAPMPDDDRVDWSSAEARIGVLSPMLSCGLALSGANVEADALGNAPGVLTAEELATFDLSSCELAVLSACDTGSGERLSGQGVASLQKALHIAGARAVITSLWQVPDAATKELMLDFYRRLWLGRLTPREALWLAKTSLRDARDADGNPKYSVRDWAAWVLTSARDGTGEDSGGGR